MVAPEDMTLSEFFDCVLEHLGQTIDNLQNRHVAMRYQTDTSLAFQQRFADIGKGLQILARLHGEITRVRLAHEESSAKQAKRSEPAIRQRLLETLTVSRYARTVLTKPLQ